MSTYFQVYKQHIEKFKANRPESSLSVCATCLSSDRKLYALHNADYVLKRLVKGFSAATPQQKLVCWECWALLMKVHKFITKARSALIILRGAPEDLIKSRVGSASTLGIQKLDPFNIESDANMDFEIDEPDNAIIINTNDNSFKLCSFQDQTDESSQNSEQSKSIQIQNELLCKHEHIHDKAFIKLEEEEFVTEKDMKDYHQNQEISSSSRDSGDIKQETDGDVESHNHVVFNQETDGDVQNNYVVFNDGTNYIKVKQETDEDVTSQSDVVYDGKNDDTDGETMDTNVKEEWDIIDLVSQSDTVDDDEKNIEIMDTTLKQETNVDVASKVNVIDDDDTDDEMDIPLSIIKAKYSDGILKQVYKIQTTGGFIELPSNLIRGYKGEEIHETRDTNTEDLHGSISTNDDTSDVQGIFKKAYAIHTTGGVMELQSNLIVRDKSDKEDVNETIDNTRDDSLETIDSDVHGNVDKTGLQQAYAIKTSGGFIQLQSNLILRDNTDVEKVKKTKTIKRDVHKTRDKSRKKKHETRDKCGNVRKVTKKTRKNLQNIVDLSKDDTKKFCKNVHESSSTINKAKSITKKSKLAKKVKSLIMAGNMQVESMNQYRSRLKNVAVKYEYNNMTMKNMALCPCPDCPKRFSCRSMMGRHWDAIHAPEWSFRCTHCEESFNTKIAICAHQLLAHKSDDDGPRLAELREHMFVIDRPYSCNFCEARFRSQRSLQTHYKYAHGEEH